MPEYRFTCPLPNGLHARPASMIADAVRPFISSVTLAKHGGNSVNARSVLSIVGLDIKQGDSCLFTADGPDAPATLAAFQAFVETELGNADRATPAPSRST